MTVYHQDDRVTLHHGDALNVLRVLPGDSVDCIVTSPPYFFMRDYGGEAGQYGLEATPQQYIETIAAVMREARRVLAPTGTLWLNVGDAYSQRKAIWPSSHQDLHTAQSPRLKWRDLRVAGLARMSAENLIAGVPVPEKSLMMLPDRIALAMQTDGWIMRNKIVWAKTFTKPDTTPDRLASRWEPIHLFVKRYRGYTWTADGDVYGDVWSMPAATGGGEDHTARFPDELPRRCISLGSAEGGVVLDPFCGSGTTGRVALALGRRFVGIDLHRPYLDLALRTHLQPMATGRC